MRRKIRKFADREQTSKQTENSKTEATLVLCGSSGERANYRADRPGGLILYCTVLYCTVLYKIRKFAQNR